MFRILFDRGSLGHMGDRAKRRVRSEKKQKTNTHAHAHTHILHVGQHMWTHMHPEGGIVRVMRLRCSDLVMVSHDVSPSAAQARMGAHFSSWSGLLNPRPQHAAALTTHYANERGSFFFFFFSPAAEFGWFLSDWEPPRPPHPPTHPSPPPSLLQPTALPLTPVAPQTGAIQARQVAAYAHNC